MKQCLHLTKPAYLTALVALTAAGLIAASCGGGPTSPSAGGNANLRLMLTDAPIDDVEEVNIHFVSVTAKPVGQRPTELVLELDENPIDLLTLDATVTEFAAALVPPGDYEFIHINIDEDRSSIVENGVRKSLRAPSEEIKILGGFTVDEGGVTTLTLDFDARASLLLRGNGEWLLRPVVVITGNNTSSQP